MTYVFNYNSISAKASIGEEEYLILGLTAAPEIVIAVPNDIPFY